MNVQWFTIVLLKPALWIFLQFWESSHISSWQIVYGYLSNDCISWSVPCTHCNIAQVWKRVIIRLKSVTPVGGTIMKMRHLTLCNVTPYPASLSSQFLYYNAPLLLVWAETILSVIEHQCLCAHLRLPLHVVKCLALQLLKLFAELPY